MPDSAAMPCRTKWPWDGRSSAAKSTSEPSTSSDMPPRVKWHERFPFSPRDGARGDSFSLGRFWDDVEGDGQARLVAVKRQCPVPEIRREQHEQAELGPNRQLGVQQRRRDHPRRAKAQDSFGRASRSHSIRQLNIASRGYPSPRMHVARMEALAAKTHRPTTFVP